MSTTSTNFSFVLATGSDQVDVTTHVANNFSSLDSIIGAAHTGTGQLRPNLAVTGWQLTNPVFFGNITGGNISATTGSFQTISATGGAISVGNLTVGNYSFPTTASANGTVLQLITGNAVWAANTPGTGANNGLSNLASVAINTNLGTFSAGFVTVARVIATSGALTGLTTFQASTGTFAGNLAVTGTITANAINVTGGAATFASLAIGTNVYPAAASTAGTVLTMSGTAAKWLAPAVQTHATAYFRAFSSTSIDGTAAGATKILSFNTEGLDTVGQYDTATFQYTVTASGYYVFGITLSVTAGTGVQAILQLSGSGGPYTIGGVVQNGTYVGAGAGSILLFAASGNVYTPTAICLTNATGINIFGGANSFFYGYKIPDA